MSYAFSQSGRCDPDLMMRAMAARTRKFSIRNLSFDMFCWSLLRGIFLGAGAMLFAFILLRQVMVSPQAIGLLAPLLGCVAAFLVLKLAGRSARKCTAREMLASPLYNGGCDFKVNDGGFSMQTEFAFWRIGWAAIDQIGKSDEGIFLYAGSFIYVFPKSVITDGQYLPLWNDIERWTETS